MCKFVLGRYANRLFYGLFSLHAKQKEVSQEIKTKSNKIQLGQRGVVTLRKSLNEIEARISDLDAAKEIAKQGKVKVTVRLIRAKIC